MSEVLSALTVDYQSRLFRLFNQLRLSSSVSFFLCGDCRKKKSSPPLNESSFDGGLGSLLFLIQMRHEDHHHHLSRLFLDFCLSIVRLSHVCGLALVQSPLLLLLAACCLFLCFDKEDFLCPCLCGSCV